METRFSFPMQNNGMRLPEIEKVSRLIDALRDYAITSAQASYEENPVDTYRAPCLASWDAFAWFEVVQDWELVDFLLSDIPQARRLKRSLQALLKWYGQAEIDEFAARIGLMSTRN